MIGRTVGHYRITEHLGGGGMGVVYRAEDTKLGREVALKFLPPEWSRDPEARERFLREARAASALEDARICTVHDIDETEDGQLYIAMAYYRGQTLKKRLERGRLSVGQVLDIAIQAAEGLERAHAAGIVHRDIKPANLMLTRRDEVVIVDFGLAKLAGDLSLTRTGSSLGTPHYMSPEQARGDRTDHRTDLWSLGVVLYEMLAGRRPFAGDNHAAVARAILDDRPRPLDEIRSDVTPALAAIVARALDKDPERRHQSATELLAELRALEGGPSSTEGMTLEAPPAIRRPRVHGKAVIVVAAAALAAIAAAWLLLSKRPDAPAETKPPRIAVLPFANLGSPDDAYFADGITEEITARVASVDGLEVTSRTSAAHYADSDATIQEIGRELGVDYVLEGTVRWARGDGTNRIRITPQLIRVADDTNLWAESYDRVLDDIFQIQSEIAENVTDHLGLSLRGRVAAGDDAPPTDNLDAYQAYLRGRYWATRPHFTSESWNRAIAAFQQAVELDPGFALAHAQLASGHARLRFLRHDLTPERLRAADRAAATALALGPDEPRVRLALGYYHLWAYRDVETAAEEFARARDGRPADAELLEAEGHVYLLEGRWDEALDVFRRACELSPRDASLMGYITEVLWITRRYPEAMAASDRTISLGPDSVWPYLYKTFVIWSWTGDHGRTRAVLEGLPADAGDWGRWAWYWQDVLDGRYGDALARLEPESERWLSIKICARPDALLAAQVHAWMGEPERARELWDRARAMLESAVLASPDDPRLHSSLGIAYAATGREPDAVREGVRATELLTRSMDGFYYLSFVLDLAHIYALVGQDEAACDQLEHLLANPSWISAPFLEMDPRWDPLRDDPCYQSLIETYPPDR